MRLATLLGAVACVIARAEIVEADDCGLEVPAIAERAPAIPARASYVLPLPLPPAVARVRASSTRSLGHQPQPGALTGRTVYLSAGHGWYWSATLGRWATQRGNTHDLVEDLISTETIAQHLIPLLHRMGAYVVPVRESDTNPAMVIVDDGEAALQGLQATTEAEGFATPPAIIDDGRNPFGGGGSRVAPAGTGGEAVWTFDVPAEGDYSVYASWVQAADRAPDAHYVVRHAGGEAHFRVDQRRHGSTWVLLGRFSFRAGRDPAIGALALVGDATAGTTMSIDAARIGGGVGRFDRGGGASARPRFEECARYATQWNGAPSTVWDYTDADNNDDVGSRSRFSAWEHEAGEDAVYVAWHTNAPTPARGTSSFAYGPNAFGTLADFTGVPGSLELMDAIHRELVGDLRAAWQPSWQDRGQHTAYFGEVNPSHNPEMPATLIEVAFHDTALDADSLREPRFRYLAARAIAQGIARYFATRDGKQLVLPPEPPMQIRATQADGGVAIGWAVPVLDPAAGDPPSSYRVYLSADGQAFDAGHDVTGTTFAVPASLVREAPVFARVTAVNPGGESRPSPVVAARRASDGNARVLIVAGFDRLTGDMFLKDDLSAYGLATIDRGLEYKLNDGSYAARHGLALAEAGYSFDTITRDALATIDLSRYAAVDWLGGEDAIDTGAAPVARYLEGGGRVLATGSELVAALATAGDPLLDRLGVGLVDGNATAASAIGIGGPFAGLPALAIGDDRLGGYYPHTVDILDARGATAVLAYEGGAIAGTFLDTETMRAVVFGFPLETVADAATRTELVRRAFAALGVEPDPLTEEEVTEAGCCGAGGDRTSALFAVVVLVVLRKRRR